MRFLSQLKGFIHRKPASSFFLNGRPLDPGKSYEFLIAVNFEKEDSARLCEVSLAYLKLPTRLKGMENGRWNINITFTELGDATRLAAIKNAIEEAAAPHGGKILLFTAS